MISDSIDAMLTDRPYRKALTVDSVRNELTRNSGTQFDPSVVEATFQTGLLDEIERAEPEIKQVPPRARVLE